MSPEQIAMISSLVALVKMLSAWPVVSIILLMVIGPWVMAMMLFYSTRKRFEAVVDMYESNVRLVEKYEKIATDLNTVVMVNTETFSKLTEAIEHNQFCPIVREKGGTG
jgi:hypothetical protein